MPQCTVASCRVFLDSRQVEAFCQDELLLNLTCSSWKCSCEVAWKEDSTSSESAKGLINCHISFCKGYLRNCHTFFFFKWVCHWQAQCEDCGKLVSRAGLARHKRTCSLHLPADGVSKVYVCPSPCLQKFDRADHLKQHRRGSGCLHNGSLCPLCEVVVKFSLKTHQRKCTAKYRCAECGQAFQKKNTFKKHVEENHYVFAWFSNVCTVQAWKQYLNWSEIEHRITCHHFCENN